MRIHSRNIQLNSWLDIFRQPKQLEDLPAFTVSTGQTIPAKELALIKDSLPGIGINNPLGNYIPDRSHFDRLKRQGLLPKKYIKGDGICGFDSYTIIQTLSTGIPYKTNPAILQEKGLIIGSPKDSLGKGSIQIERNQSSENFAKLYQVNINSFNKFHSKGDYLTYLQQLDIGNIVITFLISNKYEAHIFVTALWKQENNKIPISFEASNYKPANIIPTELLINNYQNIKAIGTYIVKQKVHPSLMNY